VSSPSSYQPSLWRPKSQRASPGYGCGCKQPFGLRISPFEFARNGYGVLVGRNHREPLPILLFGMVPCSSAVVQWRNMWWFNAGVAPVYRDYLVALNTGDTGVPLPISGLWACTRGTSERFRWYRNVSWKNPRDGGASRDDRCLPNLCSEPQISDRDREERSPFRLPIPSRQHCSWLSQ
jgi:hypothetical protein